MEIAAILTVGAIALAVCAVLVQMMRWRERAFDRKEQVWAKERQDLINRIMYLSEKPWSGPPEYEPLEVPDTLPLPIYAEQEALD